MKKLVMPVFLHINAKNKKEADIIISSWESLYDNQRGIAGGDQGINGMSGMSSANPAIPPPVVPQGIPQQPAPQIQQGNMGGAPTPQASQMPPPQEMKQMERPVIKKEFESEKFEIKHYVITASEIIREEIFPGKYIPLVLLRGKRRNIEGKTYVRGLVRDAKDPQKLFNYWTTASAEIIALAPKAPWVAV